MEKNGKISQSRILESLGKSGCDEAALKAATGVEWEPALNDGKPVSVWVAIPIIFSLDKRTDGSAWSDPLRSGLEPRVGDLQELNVRGLGRRSHLQVYDSPPLPIGGLSAIERRIRYAVIARKAGIEGRVVVVATVSAEGEVLATKVVESLGDSGCDQAALTAVESVAWQPAMLQGKPVPAQVAVPVLFKL